MLLCAQQEGINKDCKHLTNHFWSNWLEWTVLIIYTIQQYHFTIKYQNNANFKLNHLQLLILSYQWTILWSTIFCSLWLYLCISHARLIWCSHNCLNSDIVYKIFTVHIWSYCMHDPLFIVSRLIWRTFVASARNHLSVCKYLQKTLNFLLLTKQCN